MALNYTITVLTPMETKTQSGRVEDFFELGQVVNELTKDNIKGLRNVVKISYTEVSQAQLNYEEKKKALGITDDDE